MNPHLNVRKEYVNSDLDALQFIFLCGMLPHQVGMPDRKCHSKIVQINIFHICLHDAGLSVYLKKRLLLIRVNLLIYLKTVRE